MILAAVSAETRTAPPLRTLLAVWKLTPARAATSLMETYRRAMGSCPSRERTFALLNVVSAHMTGQPRFDNAFRDFPWQAWRSCRSWPAGATGIRVRAV